MASTSTQEQLPLILSLSPAQLRAQQQLLSTAELRPRFGQFYSSRSARSTSAKASSPTVRIMHPKRDCDTYLGAPDPSMTTDATQNQSKSDIDGVIEEPAAQRPRLELAAAYLDYKLFMLSGRCVQIRVAPDGRARDLYGRVRESGSLAFPLFHIIGEGGRILVESDALPAAGTALKLVVENPTELCEAAQKVIREAPASVQGRGDPALLQRLRLGRCCELGTFERGQWTGPRHPDDDEPSDFDEPLEEEVGLYHVCELELIDGEDRHRKLVAVISQGYLSNELPPFGPVYLRPDFKRVACLLGEDEIASTWCVEDDASDWYKDPVTPLPPSICNSIGGWRARSPLGTHLAHALSVAVSGNSLCPGDIMLAEARLPPAPLLPPRPARPACTCTQTGLAPHARRTTSVAAIPCRAGALWLCLPAPSGGYLGSSLVVTLPSSCGEDISCAPSTAEAIVH